MEEMFRNNNQLINKIMNKTAKIGIIGLGYVGLPLAIEEAKAGYKVIGFEINQTKVDSVNTCKNYINDINNIDLENLVLTGFLKATSDFSQLELIDCVSICVPTPLDEHQKPDISYIISSIKSIVPYLHKEMLIILESTTYPGTTKDLVMPILESTGLKCGEDFYLVFSPERVDPGNKIYKTNNTPKIVGGITPLCSDVATALFNNVLKVPVYRVSSTSVAEMEKLLENTYRNINIGLVNELAILCNKIGINIWEVIDAAETKPYGFQPFYPGPGLGGHCIPLDPYYLDWKAREYKFHTSMIETSGKINDYMPEYCTERASKILNRFKKSLNGSKILILGIAYKNDIDDYRESPAIQVISCLEKEGAIIDYFDPWVPLFEEKGIQKKSIPVLTKNVIESYELIIITTAHANIDYSLVQKNAFYIFDTRNAMKNITNRNNIELL